MEKLYFKLPISLVVIIAVLVFSGEVFATKMARTQLFELLKSADIVAVVLIENSRLTVEAARIADTFIELPKSIKPEKGFSAKNEQASYVWIDLSDIVQYMKNTASEN